MLASSLIWPLGILSLLALIVLKLTGMVDVPPACFWIGGVCLILSMSFQTVAGWLASRNNFTYDHLQGRSTWGRDREHVLTLEDFKPEDRNHSFDQSSTDENAS